MTFVQPPALRPGDLVAVVAPSSPFDVREFWRGLGWLRGRYRIRMRSDIFERQGYLAGSDQRRAVEFSSALRDPEVKAILVARGGYGATRFVEWANWSEVPSPKWIVGFSDVTALHLMGHAMGMVTIHGPHVTGLAHASPLERYAFIRALETPQAGPTWTGLTPIVRGDAEGRLIGGNLALVQAMATMGMLKLDKGSILVLEDVTERPYRVDRMLSTLLSGCHLQNVSAVVFGSFAQCDPGPDGITVEDVIRDRADHFGVPVYTGAPFGHGPLNAPFTMGLPVRLQAGTLRPIE